MLRPITRITRRLALTSLAAASLFAAQTSASLAETVNVYSYRQTFLMEPLFQAFEQETGIKVNFLYASKGLLERAKAEGSLSPVDVFLTSDFGLLHDAKTMGLTQALDDAAINAALPAKYRDSEGHWFGLTRRARVIFAAKDRIDPASVQRYEDLTKLEFKGQICIRSGTHSYNIGLFAAMIAAEGEAATQAWLEGIKANLARRPQGNDRAQVKAIKEGECSLAIGNTYYMGKMLNNPEQVAWAEAVNMIFPNQGDRGTHVNISGMALAKYAPNREAALTFMRFLLSDKAQAIYSAENYEYPVVPGVEPSELLKSWGDFKAEDLPLSAMASQREAASKLVEKLRFNN